VNGFPVCAVRERISGDLTDIAFANQAPKLSWIPLLLGVILVDGLTYLEEIILQHSLFYRNKRRRIGNALF